MSENAGLQDGREEPVKIVYVAPPRARSLAIQRPNVTINKRNRMPDDRYNPFSRSGSYKPVPRPTGERKWKQNPLMPTVSFVPRSVQLQEQPLLNGFDPTKPDLIGAKEILDKGATNAIPDTTVINQIPESRNYRHQLRTVNSMLDTRAQQRRMIRRLMDRAQPNRPQIVDIDAHRARAAGKGINAPQFQTKKALSRLERQVASTQPSGNALKDVIRQQMRGAADL